MTGAWEGGGSKLYFFVTCNRGMYSNIFVGYMQLMNIVLYSSVLKNIVSYIHQRYIPRFIRQLTKKYKLYSMV
jgi:hypothetical protein